VLNLKQFINAMHKMPFMNFLVRVRSELLSPGFNFALRENNAFMV
jgi:hypothetical protein